MLKKTNTTKTITILKAQKRPEKRLDKFTFMARLRSLVLLSTFFFFASCSSQKVLDQIDDNYTQSHIEKANQLIEKKLKKSKALENIQKDPNSALYLMHGALLKHALGNYSKANLEYQKTLEAIDFYKQQSALENIQMLLIDDRRSAFSGDLYEQLLSRLFFALSLEQSGQSDNSAALLRQYQEASSLMKEEMKQSVLLSHLQIPSNPLASYLLACQLESKSDYSNAKILFESSRIEGEDDAFINKEISSIGRRSQKAWLVILVHLGQVPKKTQGYARGAEASLIALETYLDSRKIDSAWSSLTGIAIPEYKNRFNTKLKPLSIRLNGSLLPSRKMADITKMAQDELNQKLPIITARAIARQLMRRTIIYHEYTKSESAGIMADLLLLCANLTTSADLRSWSILPSEIWLARRDLNPGTIKLEVEGLPEMNLELRPGLNLIEIFAPDRAWGLFGSQKWGFFE